MKTTIEGSTPIYRSGRVLQIAGIFDLPPARGARSGWDVDLPIEGRQWNIGLIVGPSGREEHHPRALFGPALVERFEWPQRSMPDAFPAEMGIKQISGLLSSVGFSSPSAWLRPFHVPLPASSSACSVRGRWR